MQFGVMWYSPYTPAPRAYISIFRNCDMDRDIRAKLLILLYLSFVSLGLPDSVLGAAWPSMRLSFEKPLEYAGMLVSMTTILSVCSSMSCGFVTARWNTGVIITVCGFMTASAMFGYAFAGQWFSLLFFTVFFGLGQGAVDTAVNAYMSRNYSSRHMNWVHCCWGVGSTGGPLLMTMAFSLELSWRVGYAAIGAIQLVLSCIFLFSLRLWSKASENPRNIAENKTPPREEKESEEKDKPITACLAGTLFYFAYPGIEMVVGLWGASYLVEQLGASPSAAAISITLFWASLTLGRFLVGFVATRMSNAAIIRTGLLLAATGTGLIAASESVLLNRAALLFIGLGIAPLYPTMMHDTLHRVGQDYLDRQIGLQVGGALAGSAVLPALVGLAARHASLALFGYAVAVFIFVVFLAHEVSFRAAARQTTVQ